MPNSGHSGTHAYALIGMFTRNFVGRPEAKDRQLSHRRPYPGHAERRLGAGRRSRADGYHRTQILPFGASWLAEGSLARHSPTETPGAPHPRPARYPRRADPHSAVGPPPLVPPAPPGRHQRSGPPAPPAAQPSGPAARLLPVTPHGDAATLILNRTGTENSLISGDSSVNILASDLPGWQPSSRPHPHSADPARRRGRCGRALLA
jgi:hypothetical protein